MPFAHLLPTTIVLPDGRSAELRPLQPDDTDLLATYLGGMSETTRSLWGPHGFSPEAAAEICSSLAPDRMLRLVAVVEGSDGPRFVAYFLLDFSPHQGDQERYAALGITLEQATTATMAPSVAEGLQGAHLGSALMPVLLAVARWRGMKRVVLWGGVQERNLRARRFYEKWGFRKVGEFPANELNNFDMMLDL